MEYGWMAGMAAVAVGSAALVYVVMRGRLQVRIDHEHRLDREGAKLVGKGIDTAGKAADKAFRAVTDVAHTAREVVKPLADGAGSILEAIASKIRDKQAARDVLIAQREALQDQVQQLRSRHVDVTQVEQQLKVAFISVTQEYKSWRKQRFDEQSSKLMGLVKGSHTEYLALVSAKFRTHLGIDLQKLGFTFADETTILVDGAKRAEVIGFKDLAITPLHKELRKVTRDGDGRPVSIEVMLDDKHLADRNETHLVDLVAEIQKSETTSHLEEANARLTVAFLQTCIGAGRYKFQLTTDPLAEPITFAELCARINHSIDEQLRALEAERNKVAAEVKALDAEILLIATQAPAVQALR